MISTIISTDIAAPDQQDPQIQQPAKPPILGDSLKALINFYHPKGRVEEFISDILKAEGFDFARDAKKIEEEYDSRRHPLEGIIEQIALNGMASAVPDVLKVMSDQVLRINQAEEASLEELKKKYGAKTEIFFNAISEIIDDKTSLPSSELLELLTRRISLEIQARQQEKTELENEINQLQSRITPVETPGEEHQNGGGFMARLLRPPSVSKKTQTTAPIDPEQIQIQQQIQQQIEEKSTKLQQIKEELEPRLEIISDIKKAVSNYRGRCIIIGNDGQRHAGFDKIAEALPQESVIAAEMSAESKSIAASSISDLLNELGLPIGKSGRIAEENLEKIKAVAKNNSASQELIDFINSNDPAYMVSGPIIRELAKIGNYSEKAMLEALNRFDESIMIAKVKVEELEILRGQIKKAHVPYTKDMAKELRKCDELKLRNASRQNTAEIE